MKRWQGWIAAAVLAGTAAGAYADGAEANPPDKAGEAPVAAEAAGAGPADSGPSNPLRDPFAMRGTGADGDAYIHAGLASIPPGIRVVAILSMEGKKNVGALSIPGSPHLHFVREGEVIQLDTAGAGPGAASASQLYLLVKSITENEVEIAPQARPQDVRIYR